jgi:AraC family L-rhamnose operon regulatory protein RhaS
MKYLDVIRPVEVTLPPHGIKVIESHHGQRFEPVELCHTFAKFLFVLDGKGILQANKKFVLYPSALVYVPAGLRHTLMDRESPLVIYAVCFDPRHFDRHLQDCLSRDGIHHWSLAHQSPHLLTETRRDIRELMHEQRDLRPGWQCQQHALINQLLVRAVRLTIRESSEVISSSEGSGVHRVQKYIDSFNYRMLHDTLDTAASACGISRRRFTDLFKTLTGETFHTYVRKRRIERAKQLLIETDLSVAGVAFESGFEDISHFHRIFRILVGQTPGDFGKSHRQ